MFEYLESAGSQERVVSVTLLEVQSFKCKWLSITVEKKETPLYLCFHTHVCNKETTGVHWGEVGGGSPLVTEMLPLLSTPDPTIPSVRFPVFAPKIV